MKKQLLKSMLMAVVGVGMLAGSAFALPTLADLAQGTDYEGLWPSLNETGAELVYLTDTDGNTDSSTSALKFALGSYSDNQYLTFGIFDYSTDNTLQYLPLFNTGINPLLAEATVNFSGSSATFGANTIYTDGTFGFYIFNSNTNTYLYSVSALNNDGAKNHALIYDTEGITGAGLFGATVVVAFEDVLGGGDLDFDDVVVGVTDVAPVPEPATMLLFGTGIAGLAGIARRRKANEV